MANPEGLWSSGLAGIPLPDGHYEAVVTERRGDAEASSLPVEFDVVTNRIDQPTLTTPADGADLTTPRPRIARSTQPGASVDVMVDGMRAGRTRADQAGHFALVPDRDLAAGEHHVQVVATDEQGDVSKPSIAHRIVIRLGSASPAPSAPASPSSTGAAPATPNSRDHRRQASEHPLPRPPRLRSPQTRPTGPLQASWPGPEGRRPSC